MKFLFRLCAALLTLGILSLVGGVVGLLLLVLLPVAVVLGGGLLAVFVFICCLALFLF